MFPFGIFELPILHFACLPEYSLVKAKACLLFCLFRLTNQWFGKKYFLVENSFHYFSQKATRVMLFGKDILTLKQWHLHGRANVFRVGLSFTSMEMSITEEDSTKQQKLILLILFTLF